MTKKMFPVSTGQYFPFNYKDTYTYIFVPVYIVIKLLYKPITLGQTRFFSLGETTSLREGKL